MSRSKASASSSPIFKIQDEDRFYLNDDFIEQYKNREPKWGPVGKIAYVRTYARELRGEELVQFLMRDMKMARKEAGAKARQIKSKREEFWQTARRVVEFAWTVFQRQARMSHHAWNGAEAQEKAQEMFRRLWDFKWLPPGRGMQFAGTPVVAIKGGAVLNNCGFLSTQYWNDTTDRARYSEVFGRFMDFLMLGVGMGSDVRGAKAFVVQAPKPFDGDVHIVEDSREGWVHALRMKLDSYFIGHCEVEFEFSNIRDAGKLLKTLGGTASGSAPLERLLARIDEILKPLINHPITQAAITDIFNEIGVCVVSGNIRRSAEIMIGENGDREFAALKDPSDIVKWSEERAVIEDSNPTIFRIRRRIDNLRAHQVGLSAANATFIHCQDKIDRAQARIQKIAQQNPEWVRLTANIMNHPLNTHRWACVTGDTLVDTTEGMLPISRLVGRSDVVVRLNGETHSALGIKLTGNEPTFRVITKGGPSVRATSNHQFMTSRGWVRTDQLTEGDCLLASSKKVPIDQTATDYKRGYLMGMLIGDGTFTKTTTTKTPIARIQTYTRDLGNASLRAYIEGIFDFETRRDFRGFSGPHGNGDSQYHFLSAKKFTDFAASYGVTKGSKTITDLIEQSASLELQAGVLSGFFDADGWVLSDRRTLAVDQADLKILERAQRMLLRLGIASRINKVRNADERVFPGSTKRSCKPVWRLTICGYAHASTFVSVCGIHHSEKLSKWRAIEPPQSTKKSHAYAVDSVDPTGVSEDVYDICVPGPCAFSANGLYVHNSNNTQLFDVEDDFTEVAKQIATNGEPGVAFLSNIRNNGRMNDARMDINVMGFNPCQIGSAPVLTQAGIRTFDEISEGSVIWSGNQWTRVIKKWCTGVKPAFAVRTTAGVFYGTENHRIVSNGVKVEVGEAESIDISVGPAPEAVPIDPQFIIDGLIVGDGYYEAKREQNLLIQGSKDFDYQNSEVGHLLGERVPTSYNYKCPLWAVKTTIKEPLRKTYEREVPVRYLKGTSVEVRGFLRGLYSANGSVVASRVTLKASSRKVIDSVQQMLSSIGIASYATTNQAHVVSFDNGDYECKESYDLNIGTRQGRTLFRDLIGFIQKDKMDRLNALFDKPISPYDNGKTKTTFDIVSREPLGEQRVYDITVEADEHTYWTGGLLVSNCAEQPLEDGELCCLGELNPNVHENVEDFLATIKYAYMYCKAVTLVPTHDQATNKIMTKNRRIGLSMMGIWKMYERLGMQECIRWWDWGYEEVRKWDKTYSEWLGVNESIKVTSVKPGGTIPLLVGEEGGMKIPTAKHYFRTIRMDHASPLAKACKDAGYRVEKDRTSPRTVVVYFPVFDESTKRTAEDVSMWEQMGLLAELQAHWSDNMVSNTITFKPQEASEIAQAIAMFAHRIKAVSFLPLMTHGYAQAPYIPIEQWEYELAVAKIGSLDLTKGGHEVDEKYCTGDVCMRAG